MAIYIILFLVPVSLQHMLTPMSVSRSLTVIIWHMCFPHSPSGGLESIAAFAAASMNFRMFPPQDPRHDAQRFEQPLNTLASAQKGGT